MFIENLCMQNTAVDNKNNNKSRHCLFLSGKTAFYRRTYIISIFSPDLVLMVIHWIVYYSYDQFSDEQTNVI